MFICKECLDEFAPGGSFEYGGKSRGDCEYCGKKDAQCSDIPTSALMRWQQENKNGGDVVYTTEKVKVESTKYAIKDGQLPHD